MNEIKLVGSLQTADIEKCKVNSGYLNRVLFKPDYDGKGFVNSFGVEIHTDTADVNDILDKLTKSQESVDNWYDANLKVELTGRLRANNYKSGDSTVYQNIIEVKTVDFQ